MTDTKEQVHIVIKGYYDKPNFNNRFTIEWPFSSIPSIGHYVDIRTFLSDPPEEMLATYHVDMVQWSSDGPYIMLLPIKCYCP